MSRRALLLGLLVLVGLLKAGALVWVGARLGLAPWVVVLSAGAWVCGPALAGWMWHRRRALPS